MNIEIEIKYKVKIFFYLMKEKRLAFLKLFLSLFKNLEKELLKVEELTDINHIFKSINKYLNVKLWLSYYKSICKSFFFWLIWFRYK